MNEFENKSFLAKNGVWLVVLLAFIVFGFLLFKGWDKVLNNEIDEMATITGQFSCLPLKEGVVQSEDACFLGLKSRDGLFYALDVSKVQDANTDLKADDTIAVTGFIKPESDIPGSAWAEHDIEAIIQVNTMLRTR